MFFPTGGYLRGWSPASTCLGSDGTILARCSPTPLPQTGLNFASLLIRFTPQSQERQTFYLSEEERRTLITEGLPVPMGYPLSKVKAVHLSLNFLCFTMSFMCNLNSDTFLVFLLLLRLYFLVDPFQ